MKIHTILLAIAALIVADVEAQEDRIKAIEARPLDPDAQDIIGEFHRIGLPKYNDVEKRIIDRAQKVQDEQTAIYNRIALGNSVFDYPGLIALGSIQYYQRKQFPYALTFGIRPHISEFAASFCEYRIEFDDKGIVKGKTKVSYENK
jgi:hypothetical protein